ncbi:MAG: di-heme enzyme [Pseudomonadota bacterium]|nr:di-heme enzyme [Pseudomonadota bacterium]
MHTATQTGRGVPAGHTATPHPIRPVAGHASQRLGLLAALAALLTLGAGCGGGDSDAPPAPQAQARPDCRLTPSKEQQRTIYTLNCAPQTTSSWNWELPAHMPAPRVPVGNPMNAAKVELGRHLFYDKRLSGNGSFACATCHLQAKAFTDGRALALGATGQLHVRSPMALVNVAWNASYTWGNPMLTSLEQQSPNPIFGDTPVELGVNDSSAQAVLQRLRSATDVDYVARFAAAFPGEKPDAGADLIDWPRIQKAISTFERTLISVNSKYDQMRQGQASYTPLEARGLAVFKEARCIACHQEPNFTDQFVTANTTQLTLRWHNKGLYNLLDAWGRAGADPLDAILDSQGLIDLTGNLADMGAYKTPTLRNIEMTAPYGHDGSIATLEEAVEIFTSGGRHIARGPNAGDGRANPHKSPLIQDRGLNAEDKAALVAFLKTLTDPAFLTNPALSDPFP